MNDARVLELMKNGQEEYEKIKGKELHYVYLKGRLYEEVVLKPQSQHFMHLCGINYIDPSTKMKYSANQFYKILKNGRINLRWIEKKNNYTDQKLLVLNNLKDLLDCKVKVIDEQVTLVHLEFYKGFRSRRKIYCFPLTLESRGKSEEYVTYSLLNLQTDPRADKIPTGCHVHCIYEVEGKSREVNIICKTPEFDNYESENTYTYDGIL